MLWLSYLVALAWSMDVNVEALPVWCSAFVVLGTLQAGVGFVQIYALHSQPSGTLGHVAYFAAFCGGAALVAFGCLLDAKRRITRVAFGLAAGVASAGLIVSGRRGPLLAFVAAITTVFLSRFSGKRRFVWVAVAAAGLVVGGFLLTLPGVDDIRPADRWLGAGDARETVSTRIDIYGDAWRGILERPLMGWGFVDLREINTGNGGIYSQFEGRVHNLFLETGLIAGFAGMLTLILLFSAIAFRLVKSLRLHANGPLAGRLTCAGALALYYGIHLMTNVDQAATGAWVVAIVSFPLTATDTPLAATGWSPKKKWIALGVVILLGTLVLVRVAGNALVGAGARLERVQQLDAAEQTYRAAMWLSCTDCVAELRLAELLRHRHKDAAGQERREWLSRCAQRIPRNPFVHYELALAEMGEGGGDAWRRAVEHAGEAHRLLPTDPELAAGYGELLARTGQIETARAVLTDAAAAPTATASVHNNLGVVLERLGRWQEALSSFQHAIDLAPGVQRYQDNLVRVQATISRQPR